MSERRAAAGEALLPIRTVASLTGINPVTLRAWERRYGLVAPQRAPSGHRLYTRADVERLREAAALVARGVPAGRVARLLPSPGAAPAVAAGEQPAHAADAYVARLLDAVACFDEAALSAACNEALGLYPVDMVRERILLPVLRALGECWSRRPGGIAEEHFFTCWLRDKLGARLHHLARAARGPTLLAAALPGDRHDLGLLMFGHDASVRGYRVVMLGAALPFAEIPPAARAARAHAVVLSATIEPAPRLLDPGLGELVRALAAVPVLVGGERSELDRGAIEAAGASVLGRHIAAALDWLDACLPRSAGAA